MMPRKKKSELKQKTTLTINPKVKAMWAKDAEKQEMSMSEYVECLIRKNNAEWHVFKKITAKA